jgi:hypothetical protein
VDLHYYVNLFENKNISDAPVEAISRQTAVNEKMFGPVFHGTPQNIDDVLRHGFDVQRSIPLGIDRGDRPTGSQNGFPLAPYAWGISAPVHFLGFGIYFTTVKAIAKRFNDGSGGIREFYVDTQNTIEINFGAPNTMMKWWVDNGYDMTVQETRERNVRAWLRATQNLTEHLQAKCQAVWYKGKGIRKLLDGDQLVVFNPQTIRVVDKSLSKGTDIGAMVTYDHTATSPLLQGRNDVYIADIQRDDRYAGWQGVFRAVDHDGNDVPEATGYPLLHIPPPGMKGMIMRKYPVPERFRAERGDWYVDVKWQRGGTKMNYSESELKPWVK